VDVTDSFGFASKPTFPYLNVELSHLSDCRQWSRFSAWGKQVVFGSDAEYSHLGEELAHCGAFTIRIVRPTNQKLSHSPPCLTKRVQALPMIEGRTKNTYNHRRTSVKGS